MDIAVNLDTSALYAILVSSVLIAFLRYKRARALAGGTKP